MADKAINELPAVKVSDLPLAPDIYDDTLIPVEQQGQAKHITGRQWTEYAKSAAAADVKRAIDAAENAANAAQMAETAKDSAANSASEAKKYETTAGEKATAASESAASAEKSRQAIEDMTASAETLPTGSEATVSKTVEDGVAHLQFGLPRGEKGDPGPQGPPGKDGTGVGDMLASTYDPEGRSEDIFAAIDKKQDKLTNITGLLKGNGATVEQAEAGTDYITPENLAEKIQSGTTAPETLADGVVYLVYEEE